MKHWLGPLMGLLFIGLLVVSFQLTTAWATILLLLGIIFYALFHNPMQHVHETRDESTKPRRRTKKHGSR